MPRHNKPGERIYTEFKDTNGCVIRIQKSYISTSHCAWIFTHDPKLPNGEIDECSPHINVQHAKRLIVALQKFIDGK